MMEFSVSARVYLEDSDAQGIVYYVNYLKFMERARTELLRDIGFDFQLLRQQQGHFVVHSVDVRYLKPAYVDDELQITATVTKTAKTYVVFSQEVRRVSPSNVAEQSDLLCAGQVKVACVSSETGRPISIPTPIAREFLARTEQ